MRHRRLLGVGIFLLGLTVQTGVARAAHVNCGHVITTDTTLDADVGPCPGDGIVIGASNITLDLGGHSVLGTGSSAGILVRLHNQVRITNGTVAGFAEGVSASQSSNNVIEELVVRNNRFSGIALGANFNNRVSRNVVIGNGGSGIGTGASANNLIESNAIRRNGGPGISLGGRSLSFAANGNTVSRNTISSNGGDGVLLGRPLVTETQILGNTISNNGRNGVLVSVFSFDQCCDVIQNNVIRSNAANGVLIEGNRPLGAPAGGSLDNRIIANTALANRSFDLADENPGCANNRWVDNRFATRNEPCIG